MKTDLQPKQTAEKETSLSVNEVSAKEQNQIILYHPNDTISLEVRLENDTVWLTQEMMSDLFQRNKSTISRHVKNIFQEKELLEESVVAKFATTASDGKIYQVDYYNLDVVISVGYRVKSIRGTQFRQWANKVLKEYLLRGHALNYKFELIEEQLKEHRAILDKHEDKIDFFVRTSLPPVEGVFHNGQIFDAYKFATDLIKSANKSLVLIDNYIDESVLLMLSKRKPGVSADIYTYPISHTLRQDLQKHNRQYSPINIHNHTTSHDRFLIIDDTEVYHIGASLKDLGKKLFAFSKLNIPPSAIL
ncbi:MAG: virulence RhuM family protein [Paludibacteraceae bacterium]|nr:virulence RhuM family protein [Paludibacteraceae bacterium]